MGRVQYSRHGYIVFKARNGWVAYNTNKRFEEGHTHLQSYHSAKDAINFCIECRVPMKASEYYLISLQRLTNNKRYYLALQQRIEQIKKNGRYCDN